MNISHNTKHGEYDAWGLELVIDAAGAVVYLEFNAWPAVSKGINAYLQSADHRITTGLMWEGGLPIRLALEGRYWQALRRLECGMDNLVIAHQGVGAAATTAEIYFISEGGAQPTNFAQRLKQALPIGILEEWPPLIWQHLTQPTGSGPHRHILTKLRSQGDLEMWQMNDTKAEVWAGLLRGLVLEPGRG